MITKLQIPPGVFRNGTQYQAVGRWYDASLVRFRKGAVLPVGGWSQYGSDVINGIPRGGVAWTDNSGNRWAIVGSAAYAYVMDDDFNLFDVSPSLTAGVTDAVLNGGYGDYFYGYGTYGTPRPDTGAITYASSWSFDTFGEIPIGCLDADGKLWEWDLDTGNVLTQVSGSPTGCSGLVVTAERFIFALGDGGDPRSIKWCDREDRTSWTAAATNQAGGWDLDTNGEIMCGARARGETLILTTTDAHVARYVGYPDVYEFKRVGTGCGTPGRRAAVRVDGQVFWLGHNGFFRYQGGIVQRVPCDVWDYFQEDLEKGQASKVFGWHNHEHDEVWWMYPSDTSAEIDKYIAFNYIEGHWIYGSMPAATVLPRGTFLSPVGFHTGTDLVTNGNFGADSGWTKGTNWQITGGVASQTSPSASDLSQTVSITSGVKYELIFTVANRSAGSITAKLGTTAGTARSTNATFTETITAGSGDSLLTFSADGTWDGDIDSVTLRPATTIQQQETGYDHGSLTPFLESGPIELGLGERRMHVTRLLPDEQTLGEVTVLFKTREYPTASEVTHGPYTLTEPTSVRFSGRQAVMRVAPVGETDWRFGIPRVDMRPGGKR